MKNEQILQIAAWLKGQLSESDEEKQILIIIGPEDSGKTTLANTVASYLDAPVHNNFLPNDFSLLTGKTLIFDDVHSLANQTGAEHRFAQLIEDGRVEQRKLFTNDKSVILNFHDVNIILTATDNDFTGDVLRRSIVIELEEIPDKKFTAASLVTQRISNELVRALCSPIITETESIQE